MRRVAVLGCGGAGKTTLANALGAALGLPVVHGDFLGRRGDERAQGDEWCALEAVVLREKAWVLDAMRLGSLDARLARADTAVFLDLPRHACLAGVARRRLRLRGRCNPVTGVADRVNLAFLVWVWRFRRVERPTVLAVLERHRATTRIVVLRSRRQVRRFVRDTYSHASSSRPASSSSSIATRRASTPSQPA